MSLLAPVASRTRTGSAVRLARSTAGWVLAAAALGAAPAALAATSSVDTCAGRVATVLGTAGDDTLTGTPGDDVIAALAGDDILDGRGGDDLLCGGRGSDVLRGGAGDDRLAPGPEVVSGDPDLVIYDRAARAVRVDLEAATAVGEGRDTLTGRGFRLYGSEHDDELTGWTQDSNRLAGLGGADVIRGGALDDVLHGDSPRPTRVSGADRIHGLGGDDLAVGGPGPDRVRGGAGDDSIEDWWDGPVPSGGDRYFGGTGQDFVLDHLEADQRQVFAGGPGQDEIIVLTRFFREGRRSFPAGRVDLAAQTWATTGADSSSGPISSFEKVTVPGGWTLLGSAHDEVLWGPRTSIDPAGRGVVVRGRGGDDNLIGSRHADLLDGGAGTDAACSVGGRDTVRAVEHRARNPIDLCDPR